MLPYSYLCIVLTHQSRVLSDHSDQHTARCDSLCWRVFNFFVRSLLVCFFQLFVELSRIKKCFTQKGGFFILEELGKTLLILTGSERHSNERAVKFS